MVTLSVGRSGHVPGFLRFLALAAVFPLGAASAERVQFIPSHAPVRTVVLQYPTMRIAGGNLEVLPDGAPVAGNNATSDALAFFRTYANEVLVVDSAGGNLHCNVNRLREPLPR